MLEWWDFLSGVAQGLILFLVGLAVSMLRDVRREVRTINGKVIRLEQWKEDRPCERPGGHNPGCADSERE